MKIDHENHACVPIVGLDVVVAAVERLPESLHTRVEQVRHPATLLQANERPEPPSIVTPEALQLNEVPIADTGRYDPLGEKLSPLGHYCPMLRSGHLRANTVRKGLLNWWLSSENCKLMSKYPAQFIK